MRQIAIGLAVMSLVLLLPTGADADTIFQLENPGDGATVAGIVAVYGWVLDDRGSCGPPPWNQCEWHEAPVSNIDLYVDGVFTASADLNIPRYDVLQAYPWYLGTPADRPGFSTSFNADDLVDGEHTLFVKVTFSDASVQDYGHRTVTVDKAVNQPPFGKLEMPGPQAPYQEYSPHFPYPMNGVFPVTGWALDDGYVTDVEVLVDGQVWGHAVTGVHRPDVANLFPGVVGAEYAGFVRVPDTTEMTNGVHFLAIRLRDDQGATRVVGRRMVQVFNNGYNLAPFGGIDYPISNHYMLCNKCSSEGGWSGPSVSAPSEWDVVLGWALDVGSRTDEGGVKWVEVMMNGTILANTLVDHFWFPWMAMDVNHYGLERLDILRLFPGVPNAKVSGFSFAINICDLILGQEYHQGLHYLSIRAGDIEGNIGDLATIPVILDCDDDPDRPAWGDIYTPENMEMIAGTFQVTGWAIDFDHIAEVEVWVDGMFMGYASHSLPSQEVADTYPWFPYNLAENAGFAFNLDTTRLTDGEHLLVIRIEDAWGGHKNFLGERLFVVDNLN